MAAAGAPLRGARADQVRDEGDISFRFLRRFCLSPIRSAVFVCVLCTSGAVVLLTQCLSPRLEGALKNPPTHRSSHPSEMSRQSWTLFTKSEPSLCLIEANQTNGAEAPEQSGGMCFRAIVSRDSCCGGLPVLAIKFRFVSVCLWRKKDASEVRNFSLGHGTAFRPLAKAPRIPLL